MLSRYLTGSVPSIEMSQSYDVPSCPFIAILKGSFASLTFTLNQSSQSCSLQIGFPLLRSRLYLGYSGRTFVFQRYISLTGVEPMCTSFSCLFHAYIHMLLTILLYKILLITWKLIISLLVRGWSYYNWFIPPPIFSYI